MPMGAGSFPAPVRIVMHPRTEFACWGWLTELGEHGNVRISILDGTASYRHFDDLDACVRFCATTFPVGFTDEQLTMSRQSVYVRASRVAAAVPLAHFPSKGRLKLSLYKAVHIGKWTNPACMMQSPDAVPEERKVKRVRRGPSRAPPSSAPPPPTALHEPMAMSTAHAGYSLGVIGGNEMEIRVVHANCLQKWDTEAVHEILRWGGRPPLHKVTRVVQRPHFREVVCVFVQPDGTLAHDVRLAMSILLCAEYAQQLSQYR